MAECNEFRVGLVLQCSNCNHILPAFREGYMGDGTTHRLKVYPHECTNSDTKEDSQLLMELNEAIEIFEKVWKIKTTYEPWRVIRKALAELSNIGAAMKHLIDSWRKAEHKWDESVS